MAYTEYTVQQGDCISSIAFERGFFPDTIWNDPRNSQLKQERQDPYVLKPGDLVYIRELQPKMVTAATEKRHRFRRKGVPEKLRVQFKVEDQPRACEAYIVTIDGTATRGRTDAKGRIAIAIPPNAITGFIRFTESGGEYQLRLGHLDPVTEISGIQGRLQNLGFYLGPRDGQMSQELTQAILDFQTARDPRGEHTGGLDDQARKEIQEAYGG